MKQCAYCDSLDRLTKEHVIPSWYVQTPGEALVFNAKKPLSHRKGEMLIKDVCQSCNNGVLSKLDAYGKLLWDHFFSRAVYHGETVPFEFDRSLLLRWLLKLSFNSARVHNADVSVLSTFRSAILGRDELPANLRCFVHLISPAEFGSKGEPSPATRDNANADMLLMPHWFRITQLRMPISCIAEVMQRAVIINSFCFALFSQESQRELDRNVLDECCDLWMSRQAGAIEIKSQSSRLNLTANGEDAAASMLPLHAEYPLRFGLEENPARELIVNGEIPVVILSVNRAMIDSNTMQPVVEMLLSMVSTRESAMGYRHRVSIMVSGFDHDTRELWEIKAVSEFFKQVFLECPFIFFLGSPEGTLIKVFYLCWTFEAAQESPKDYEQTHTDFMRRAFDAMNRVMYRLSYSSEEIRNSSEIVAAVFCGEDSK
jgi:hypothetical protein